MSPRAWPCRRRSRAGARRGGSDRRGVDAAGEQHAHRHVGDRSLERALGDGATHEPPRVLLHDRVVRRDEVGQLIPARALHAADPIHAEQRAGLEPPDPRGVNTERAERLDLAREREERTSLEDVERRLTEPIAHERERLSAIARPREGEHPLEARQRVLTPHRERGREHLRVARRREHTPEARELGAELLVVPQLAVEREDDVAVAVGLLARARGVDDREARVPEPEVRAHPHALRVRAAMPDRRDPRAHLFVARGQAESSDHATHQGASVQPGAMRPRGAKTRSRRVAPTWYIIRGGTLRPRRSHCWA